MLRFPRISLLVVIATVLPQVSCDPKDARELWTTVLKKCSNTDILGKNVLYFGPSNTMGAGSVWRHTKNKGYNLRWVASDFHAEGDIVLGQAATCQGTSSVTMKLNANVDLQKVVPTLDASAAADLSSAEQVTVSVNAWRWDLVKEGPFEQAIKAAPADIRDDLKQPDRFVMVKGLTVSGLSAELKFSKGLSAELKAKYSGSVPVGGGLSGSLASDTSLKITSSADFVIAGELGEVLSGGFAAAGRGVIGKTVSEDLSKAPVDRDPPRR
jgi:hypothetical protein